MTSLDRTQISTEIVGKYPGGADTYAEGPFIVVTPESSVFGTHLEQNGDFVTFYAGGRMYEIDDTFQITYGKYTITASSPAYDSEFLIRPVVLEDQYLGYTNAEFDSREELLEQSYLDLITDGLLGPQVPAAVTAAGTPENPVGDGAEYGITLDDDGSVLELVKTAPDGVYIRENQDWTQLDPDAPETPDDTVYGREWIDVSADAIAVFDASNNADTLTKDDFTSTILN